MLSSKFISPSIYDELTGINDNEVIHKDTLLALSLLFAFVAFKVAHLICVGLLRKHLRPAQDNIKVQNGHVCKPEPIKSPAHAADTKVQAIEDGQREPLDLPTDRLESSARYYRPRNICGGIKLDMPYCDPETCLDPC